MVAPKVKVGSIVYVRGCIWGHRVQARYDDPASQLGRGDLAPGVSVAPADAPLRGESIVPGVRGYVPFEELTGGAC